MSLRFSNIFSSSYRHSKLAIITNNFLPLGVGIGAFWAGIWKAGGPLAPLLVHLYVCQYVHTSAHPFIHKFVYPLVHLYAHGTFVGHPCPLGYMSVCQYPCISICTSIHLSRCPYVSHMSVHVWIPIACKCIIENTQPHLITAAAVKQ